MTSVLIFCGNPLFGKGVERLLGPEAGLEIIGMESNLDRATQRIAELKPDVVLLDGSGLQGEVTASLMDYLRESAGVKVIGLNLQNNCMCIYSAEQRVIKDVSDLVTAIKENAIVSPPFEGASLSELH